MAVAYAVLFYLRYVLKIKNTTHIRLLSQVAGALADDDIIAQLLVETSPQKSLISLVSMHNPMSTK